MFKEIKKYKEEKQKAQLIKELNSEVDNCDEKLLSYAKELSEDLARSNYMFDIRQSLNCLKVREDSELELRWRTIEDLAKAKKMVADLCDDYKDCITVYWEKVKKNEEELNSFFEKGVPLFITLTSLRNCVKTYAMCYEIKKYEDNEFRAYLFTDSKEEGYLDTFTYFDYKIEPMTEEEFEQYYIMGRLRVHKCWDEEETIEYDNYLRRLFHGQREVI